MPQPNATAAARDQVELLAAQVASAQRQADIATQALRAGRQPLITDLPDPHGNEITVAHDAKTGNRLLVVPVRNAGTGPALLTKAFDAPSPGSTWPIERLPALVVAPGDAVRLTFNFAGDDPLAAPHIEGLEHGSPAVGSTTTASTAGTGIALVSISNANPDPTHDGTSSVSASTTAMTPLQPRPPARLTPP